MSPDLQRRIEAAIGRRIVAAEQVGGGCIANASRIETSEGPLFLKWAFGEAGRTFQSEAAGLRELRRASSDLIVPDVLANEDENSDGPSFLVIEWIEQRAPGPGFWEEFADALASLHRKVDDTYGLDRTNFIGRLPQKNHRTVSWTEFFKEQRLMPQIRMAREHHRWPDSWETMTGKLLKRLDELLPANPDASLVHGDLWSGNFLCSIDGRAVLIDPAVYYGHREVDLAMSELFGGFPDGFYRAYQETWPLEPGYEDRREVYNLYHLINHLNHFGEGYSSGVARTLRRFGL